MWNERVRAWRASGQAAPEFAAGRGFEASTLRYWASRLRRRPAEEAPTPADGARVRMVRVTPVATSAVTKPVTVSIGAARIDVHAGFDRELLRAIVDALGGGR